MPERKEMIIWCSPTELAVLQLGERVIKVFDVTKKDREGGPDPLRKVAVRC